MPKEYQHFFVQQSRDRCEFADGSPCIFNLSVDGGSARVQLGRRQCFICDAAELQRILMNKRRSSELVKNVRLMAPASRREILHVRIPPQHRKQFAAAVHCPVGRVRHRTRCSDVRVRRFHWQQALQKRQTISSCVTDAAAATYRQEVLNDKGIARRMNVIAQRHKRGAAVDNDTGLPEPSRSERAKNLHMWCRFDSWGICNWCGNMVPRPLSEKSLTKDLPMEVHHRHCHSCRASRDMSGPKPQDVPAPLQNWPLSVLKAVQVLRVDVGPETRAPQNPGYKQRVTMIRFFWAEAWNAESPCCLNRTMPSKSCSVFFTCQQTRCA